MKIAYISHSWRPCYEYPFFSLIPCDEIRFIDTDFSSYPKNPPTHVKYCHVEKEENIFLNKFFHSTASHVRYMWFEKHLNDIDVIIVLEVFSSLSKQFVEYGKKKNIKVIPYVYELIPEHLIYKIPPYSFYTRYVKKYASSYITVSDKAKEHLIQRGFNKDKIYTIYPWINTNLFTFIPSILRNTKKIIFVWKLERHKWFDLVIQLAKDLLFEWIEFELDIIGDGSLQNEASELSQKYSNIKYYGKIENSELPKYLNSWSLYILPCRDSYKFWKFKIGSEQFWFSLVEAMSCWLSVISTDCWAIPEIIWKENIIIPQNDYQSLKKEVINLLLKNNTISYKNIDMVKQKYDIKTQANSLNSFIQNVYES